MLLFSLVIWQFSLLGKSKGCGYVVVHSGYIVVQSVNMAVQSFGRKVTVVVI